MGDPAGLTVDSRLDLPELRTAIADTYRAAALAGAKMRHVAAALEEFEAVVALGGRPFDAWDVLDDLAVKSHSHPDAEATLGLRRRFAEMVAAAEVRRIREASRTEPPSHVREYLAAISESIVCWRPDLHHALVESPPPGSLPPIVDTARSGDPHIQRQRWPELAPIFEALAASALVPVELRGRLYVVASRIALYHHPAATRRAGELLARATEAAPDHVEVALARAELLLCRDEVDEARALASRTLENDPGNVAARLLLGECLVKRGDLAGAEEYYREAARVHPGKVGAYIRLIRLTGDPRSGLDLETIPALIRRGVAAEPSEEVYLDIEAGEAFRSRREAGAAGDYFARAIAVDPDRLDGYRSQGYLLHELADEDSARRCFRKVIELAPRAVDGYWGLAFIAESIGQPVEAETWYRKAAEADRLWAGRCLAQAALQAGEQGQAEIEVELLRIVTTHGDDDFVLDAAERLGGALADRGDVPAALDFLDAVLAKVGESYRPRYHAALGNLFLDHDDTPSALEHYRLAAALEPEQVSHYVGLAVALTRLGDWEGSRGLLESAPPRVREAPTLRLAVAQMRNAEANERYSGGDYHASMQLYEEATRLAPDDDVIWSNLAGAWERDTQAPAAARTGRAIDAMKTASELAPAKADYLNRLRSLELVRTLSESYGDTVLDRRPMVEPAAVEVATDLVPMLAEDGKLSDELTAILGTARAEMAQQFGVTLPGVHVRQKPGLAPGSYVVVLMDVPVALGTVVAGRRLAVAPPDRLEGIGVDAIAGENPVDRSPASWIAEPDWAEVEAAGIELWRKGEVPVRHLRALVEGNLADFVGHEETYELLEAAGTPAAQAVIDRPEALSSLAAALRGLLSERVPVVAFDSICRRFLELLDGGREVTEIVEELRMLPDLRERLPGNHAQTTAFALGDDVAGLVARSIHVDADLAVLAMLPEDCEKVLAAARVAITGVPGATLVVADPAVRPLARKLFELEFPGLSVLSRRELVPSLEPREAIHLTGGPA